MKLHSKTPFGCLGCTYQWRVKEGPPIDLETASAFGTTNDRLVIKEDQLAHHETYTIELKGTVGL